LKITSKKIELDHQSHKDLHEKKADEYTGKHRHQMKQKDEEMFIIKDQYAQVQQIYINRVKELEDNLTKLADKYQNLDKRRLLDIEGFKTDIKNLSRKIKKVEEAGILTKSKKSDVPHEEDESQESEGDDDVESIASEELDMIKKQLAGLERKLDRARKTDS